MSKCSEHNYLEELSEVKNANPSTWFRTIPEKMASVAGKACPPSPVKLGKSLCCSAAQWQRLTSHLISAVDRWPTVVIIIPEPFVAFLSRSAYVGSRSSGCRPPCRWRWGRCIPAWRRAQWRKWLIRSSLLHSDPLRRREKQQKSIWQRERERILNDLNVMEQMFFCFFLHVLRLRSSILSTLGIVITSCSSSFSSFLLRNTVSW